MGQKQYTLKLYIAGISIENQEIILNFKNHLKQRLGEGYQLEVVDVLENPELADNEKIIATPTLVRVLPDPIQKVIVDFANEEKLLLGMDLVLKE